MEEGYLITSMYPGYPSLESLYEIIEEGYLITRYPSSESLYKIMEEEYLITIMYSGYPSSESLYEIIEEGYLITSMYPDMYLGMAIVGLQDGAPLAIKWVSHDNAQCTTNSPTNNNHSSFTPVSQQFHDSSMTPSWHHQVAKLDSRITCPKDWPKLWHNATK
ncbi:hypothetical protein C1645_834995 [Glomus cerebriforme]|uniref:Uncharacterized protein n=1 Tax=Glomus cerebriforme TaxID=658196 RepID=A0A397S8M2_9GLOM|nr:hypothetical protein C1645_834995 [Glomus cerebriforme]